MEVRSGDVYSVSIRSVLVPGYWWLFLLPFNWHWSLWLKKQTVTISPLEEKGAIEPVWLTTLPLAPESQTGHELPCPTDLRDPLAAVLYSFPRCCSIPLTAKINPPEEDGRWLNILLHNNTLAELGLKQERSCRILWRGSGNSSYLPECYTSREEERTKTTLWGI